MRIAEKRIPGRRLPAQMHSQLKAAAVAAARGSREPGVHKDARRFFAARHYWCSAIGRAAAERFKFKKRAMQRPAAAQARKTTPRRQ